MKTTYHLFIHSNSGELLHSGEIETNDIFKNALAVAKAWALNTFEGLVEDYNPENLQEVSHYSQHHFGKAKSTQFGFRYFDYENRVHESLMYSITAVEIKRGES